MALKGKGDILLQQYDEMTRKLIKSEFSRTIKQLMIISFLGNISRHVTQQTLDVLKKLHGCKN